RPAARAAGADSRGAERPPRHPRHHRPPRGADDGPRARGWLADRRHRHRRDPHRRGRGPLPRHGHRGGRAMSAITTQGLTKRFGAITAVDGIDLDVREGDVYGFLGANGSGKTTTVRMLLGLVLATSGTAEVLGRPMPRSRASVLPRVGALVEGP